MKCEACGIKEIEEGFVVCFVSADPSKEDEKETFPLCAVCGAEFEKEIAHLIIKPQ